MRNFEAGLRRFYDSPLRGWVGLGLGKFIVSPYLLSSPQTFPKVLLLLCALPEEAIKSRNLSRAVRMKIEIALPVNQDQRKLF